jgi:hypothetical protein
MKLEETNSKFDKDTNVNEFFHQIEAFKSLKRNRKKIKVGEFKFSKADFKALSDESHASPDSVGVRVLIALQNNNQIKVFLEVMYSPQTGPVPGPGVGTSPND